LALNAIQLHIPGLSNYHYHFGALDANVRFVGIFGCGALFYLYRDRILYNRWLAVLAACGLVILMFSHHTAEAAVAILGGYILFWFAFNVRSPMLATIGQKVDISYGVYLYGWPVQKTLLWLHPGVSALPLFVETTVIASILALGSWYLVEKRFLNLRTTLIPLLSRRPLSRSAPGLERRALPQKWALVNQDKEAAGG
jgi:peptidoglycan/LPS O-acetylase OafA/YrhL